MLHPRRRPVLALLTATLWAASGPASHLHAAMAADVVSPTDVTYRESVPADYGDECTTDADCGRCQQCMTGNCWERYWGECKYGSCGSTGRCVSNEETCERRCVWDDPSKPSTACYTDDDCPRCASCDSYFCERFCYACQTDADCAPGDRCGRHPDAVVLLLACIDPNGNYSADPPLGADAVEPTEPDEADPAPREDAGGGSCTIGNARDASMVVTPILLALGLLTRRPKTGRPSGPHPSERGA